MMIIQIRHSCQVKIIYGCTLFSFIAYFPAQEIWQFMSVVCGPIIMSPLSGVGVGICYISAAIVGLCL